MQFGKSQSGHGEFRSGTVRLCTVLVVYLHSLQKVKEETVSLWSFTNSQVGVTVLAVTLCVCT